MALLSLNGLTYSYPGSDRAVLDSVSFEIRKGEFVSLVGPNGSGKSTLALILAGLKRESGGECSLNPDERRRLCRIVFQNPDNQIVGETVEEDTAFGAENMGLPSSEIRRLTDEALSAVGLWEKRMLNPSSLSGGEKQKLAIAGVLVLSPSLLILDEASSMLDRLSSESILLLLRKECRERGLSVLYITHHTWETVFSDRVLILREGRIVKDGKPHETLTYDTLTSCSLTLPYALEVSHNLKMEESLTLEELEKRIIGRMKR